MPRSDESGTGYATIADVWARFLAIKSRLAARVDAKVRRAQEIDYTTDDFMMRAVHCLLLEAMASRLKYADIDFKLYSLSLKYAYAHVEERARYFEDYRIDQDEIVAETVEGPACTLEPKTTVREMVGVEKRIYEARRKRDYRARLRRQKDGE